MADLEQLFQAGWPILLMVVIFYFLLYRPQKKQQKQRNELLNSLKKGQKAVTIGGIYGEITFVSEDFVTLQIAEKTEIKLTRSGIARVLGKDEK